MFGAIILDTRLALTSVILLALLEAAGLILLRRRMAGDPFYGGSIAFVRQRAALGVIFSGGIVAYHFFKDIYIFDPFFHGLYTFLVAFALFYYLASLSAAVTAVLAGDGLLTGSSTALFAMASLVLLMVLLARPRASTFGYFSGCAAHLIGHLSGGRLENRRFRITLVVGLGIVLLVLISFLSR